MSDSMNQQSGQRSGQQPGQPIRFLLNRTEVTLTEAGPGDTVLDFLRLGRGLTGTKEGCAEGDCGACTVLVGRLHQGALVYEPINACIRFLAACHGCHVVTIEHLRGEGGGLHPVQQAMVDHHGSQCGFCTPGFVMALYGLWMTHEHDRGAGRNRAAGEPVPLHRLRADREGRARRGPRRRPGA